MLVRLTDVTSLAASAAYTQLIDQATDMGDSPHVTVFVRKLHTTTPVGTLYIQSSIALEEDGFEDAAGTFSLDGSGNLALPFTQLGKWLRWRTNSLSAAAKFQIDLVGRPGVGAASAYFRLQDPTTLSADVSQSLDGVIDILPYRSVRIDVKKIVAGGASGRLYLQHATVLDEAAFLDIDTNFTTDANAYYDLASIGIESHAFTNLGRYLRWRGDWTSGSPMFQVDVVARAA